MGILHEFEASPVVFHYNKKHNEDQSIPTWILKVKGQTFYVDHVTVNPGVGLSTKETPDNPHTKGALKFKGRLQIFENEFGRPEGLIF